MSTVSDYQKAHLKKITDFSKSVKDKLRKSGISIDPNLTREVSEPGTDQRYGVNIICRPSQEVGDHILKLQEYFRKYEPDQYYYPVSDLHLTVLEISFGGARDEAEATAAKIRSIKHRIMQDLTSFTLGMPQLVCSPHANGINFVPTGDQIERLRRMLVERLLNYGQIEVVPRYSALSAHVNFSRYIKPLSMDLGQWVEVIENVPPLPDIPWEVDQLLLTWGATWYGMKSRVTVDGPYRLSHASEAR